jgi:uncharacterized protein YjbI with pentapeptide repeats
MADLRANFNRANLFHADLRGSDLSGANLTGANLEEANLTNAKMTCAIMARAKMRDTIDSTGRHKVVATKATVRTVAKPSRPWWQFWG